MKWLLWPWRMYQKWDIQRQLHIANSANPLVFFDQIKYALGMTLPYIIVIVILSFVAIAFSVQYGWLPNVMGDIISFIALWFGLTQNRDARLINAIKAVCSNSNVTNNARYGNGYNHVLDMITNFRHQLRFYYAAIVIVTILMFFAGIAMSLL
jgi:hypothetical protein